MFEKKKIEKELSQNVQALKETFGGSSDFLCKQFTVRSVQAALVTIDGLVDKQTVAQSILNPIRSSRIPAVKGESLLLYLSDKVLTAVDQAEVKDMGEVLDRIMSGFAVLFLDGCEKALCFGVQGFAFRGISEPDNEAAQRGAKEGFVEPCLLNAAMIRRRLRTPELKFERMLIGEESNTGVVLCYLRNAVSPEILQKVKTQLKRINIQTVLSSGYLSPFLEKKSIFNDVGYTERPDTVCGKLAEGRIAVIVDGTPNVLIVPYLFIENFQSFDDYANRPFFAAFTRWLKYIAFFAAIFLPAVYVASVMYYPELLPDKLLAKVMADESATPFPVFGETLLITFLYEVVREAGLRVQKPLSSAVSIVGGFVVGEAAVGAGIVGSLTLMVVAMAYLATFVTPKLYETVGAVRMVTLFFGALLGLWGIVLTGAAVLLSMCGKSAFGIPFTAPLTPFSFSAMRDVLIRADWKKLAQKRSFVQNMPGADRKGGEK